MAVVHFMRPADGTDISAFAAVEPFETLVDDDIMHQEISRSIGHDAKANSLHPPDLLYSSEKYQQHARYGKDHKEPVVVLKKTGLLLLIVAVKKP
jgi:hypothetical protein